jgi:hypothetical protein
MRHCGGRRWGRARFFRSSSSEVGSSSSSSSGWWHLWELRLHASRSDTAAAATTTAATVRRVAVHSRGVVLVLEVWLHSRRYR